MCSYPGDWVADPEKVAERFAKLKRSLSALKDRVDSDVHDSTARLLLDKAAGDSVSSDERRLGKTINYGVIYGMDDSSVLDYLDTHLGWY
jgi:DNA polymerase I-like protein with 3'-5' exonuclease and polymerase domains